MLAGNKKNLAKPLARQMPGFGNNLIDIKCDAEDRVIPREAAVLTIVDAFIGEIERREQPHRAPKILHCERAGSLGHRFKFLIGFWGNQMLEAFDQLRFSQNKAVQGLYKRHRDNFVRTATFANHAFTKKRRPVFPTPPMQMPF